MLSKRRGDVSNDTNRAPGVNVPSLDREHAQNGNQVRVLVRQLVGLHHVTVSMALEVPQALSADRVPQVRLRFVTFHVSIRC